MCLAALGILVVNQLCAFVEAVAVLGAARVGNGGLAPRAVVVEPVIVGGLAVDGVTPLTQATPLGRLAVPLEIESVAAFEGALGDDVVPVRVVFGMALGVAGAGQVALGIEAVLDQRFTCAVCALALNPRDSAFRVGAN